MDYTHFTILLYCLVVIKMRKSRQYYNVALSSQLKSVKGKLSVTRRSILQPLFLSRVFRFVQTKLLLLRIHSVVLHIFPAPIDRREKQNRLNSKLK